MRDGRDAEDCASPRCEPPHPDADCRPDMLSVSTDMPCSSAAPASGASPSALCATECASDRRSALTSRLCRDAIAADSTGKCPSVDAVLRPAPVGALGASACDCALCRAPYELAASCLMLPADERAP
jgi:hypothetical protein